MAPTKTTDPIARLEAAVTVLSANVKTLNATVQAQGKRLQLLYSVALLVVGAIGGPNAVQLLAG
ncbi:MAG TPA: hypothetical protein VFY14_07000 [Streptomyces sp.]|jgi:hypothetical protein|nr:hypothetical protein [Streptomyces sp.]